MLAQTRVYNFNGSMYLNEFVDVSSFKESLSRHLAVPVDATPVGELYERLTRERKQDKPTVDKLFFENILYSHLNHVQVNKIGNPSSMRTVTFQQRMNRILQDLNHKEAIPNAFHEIMNANQPFFLLDRLNISTVGTKFIAALDYEVSGTAIRRIRLIYTEVIRRLGRPAYAVAGLEVDFSKQVYLVMTKFIDSIDRSEDEDAQSEANYIHSISNLENRVLEKIIQPLSITYDINVTKDRKGIFSFCKHLDDSMLDHVRSIVDRKTSALLAASSDVIFTALFDGAPPPVAGEKQNFIENSKALLTSAYINTTFSKTDLVRTAKSLRLPGFPTRISYTSTRSSRGSTESASARNPIASSEIFHSMYLTFKQATQLQVFSISWFLDYNFSKPRNTEVKQTTIYARTGSFKIIFKQSLAIGEGYFYHVIDTINRYRNYEEIDE